MDTKNRPCAASLRSSPPSQNAAPPIAPQMFPDNFFGMVPNFPSGNYFPFPIDPHQNFLQGTTSQPYPLVYPSSFDQRSVSPPAKTRSDPCINAEGEKPQQTSAKVDNSEARMYRCSKCDKAYLSYPALYTHTKLKHMKPGETPCITNGRMRGRPRKKLTVDGKEKLDPTTPLFFRTEGKVGGPSAVIYGFEDAFRLLFKDEEKYKSYTEHPLYVKLQALHLQNVKEINYDKEHPGGFNAEGNAAKNETEMIKVPTQPEVVLEEYKGLEDEDLVMRRQKACDEIFAEYLNFVARKTNKEYYKKVLTFVFFFRECVNESGERLNEEKKLLPAELFPPAEFNQRTFTGSQDYCLTNNAEQVPDVSNEFIVNFLEEKKLNAVLDTSEATDLTQNFCHWLFINGYTCSKLSLIQ